MKSVEAIKVVKMVCADERIKLRQKELPAAEAAAADAALQDYRDRLAEIFALPLENYLEKK